MLVISLLDDVGDCGDGGISMNAESLKADLFEQRVQM